VSESVLTFEVVGREYRKPAGKSAVFRVKLKTAKGDSLTLVSDSKGIYDSFPEGETVTVVVKKAQKTIADFPQGET